ncbi:MAG: XdhC/CoxI family protein [Actinomycetota bacterium]|nr:XdhC/CoxI family protein [Actinomycetota bacterium]
MNLEVFEVLRRALRDRAPTVVATVVDVAGIDASGDPDRVRPSTALGASMVLATGEAPAGSLGDPDLDAVVGRDAVGVLHSGRGALRHYGPCGEARRDDLTVFFDVFAPPPQMVVIGAVDFTAALVDVAKVLGYQVTVCDARPVFATPRRFPRADEVVAEWPDRYIRARADRLGPRDALCVLTHDHKFDVPALVEALATSVGYIGAMGSRRTHAERVQRLTAAGVDTASLARIMAPIGLDIGARTPQETAVAICAEIIALRSGETTGGHLRDLAGPIHHATA